MAANPTDWISAIATAVAAAVACVYTGVTVKIMQATRDAANATLLAVQHSTRPYVALKSLEWNPATLEESTMVCIIESVGAVPALKLQFRCVIDSKVVVDGDPSRKLFHYLLQGTPLALTIDPHEHEEKVRSGEAKVALTVTYNGPGEKRYETKGVFAYEFQEHPTRFSLVSSDMS